VKLILRWDMFNVTNSVRFDPHSINATLDNPLNFGQATGLLTNYRLAQALQRLKPVIESAPFMARLKPCPCYRTYRPCAAEEPTELSLRRWFYTSQQRFRHNRLAVSQQERNDMRNLKSAAAWICALAAIIFIAAPIRAQEPHYLHALSDLRTARDYIQSDHRHDFDHERHHAVDEINKAIDEIKHAAWDDGRQTKYAPPAQPDTDPWHPMREGVRFLDAARGDVAQGVDQAGNAGLRDRAIMHIDEAKRALWDVIQRSAH
jgi:hypothetical protein